MSVAHTLGALRFLMKFKFFSHPDFTVGFGISPNQPLARVADYTAGREFSVSLSPNPEEIFFLYAHYSRILIKLQPINYTAAVLVK